MTKNLMKPPRVNLYWTCTTNKQWLKTMRVNYKTMMVFIEKIFESLNMKKVALQIELIFYFLCIELNGRLLTLKNSYFLHLLEVRLFEFAFEIVEVIDTEGHWCRIQSQTLKKMEVELLSFIIFDAGILVKVKLFRRYLNRRKLFHILFIYAIRPKKSNLRRSCPLFSQRKHTIQHLFLFFDYSICYIVVIW